MFINRDIHKMRKGNRGIFEIENMNYFVSLL